nr:T9SS type A sorting domain-containing protein [Bacteroidota bacterium]
MPNPNKGIFKIIYLLRQNKSGLLDIIDMQGKIIYSQNLPAWSSLQNIKLPNVTQGAYVVRISSGGNEISKKMTISKGE